jgi:tRNA modification GTPase
MTARAALLTGPGRAAVAIIAVEGPAAAPLLDAAWISPHGRQAVSLVPGDLAFGRLQGPLAEELVLRRLDDERFELHAHGGHAVVQAVLDRLAHAGAAIESPRDWLARREPDPLLADAWEDLARATTLRAAEHLLAQARGALRDAFASIERHLATGQFSSARSEIDLLLARAPFGLHLVTPWRVALVGPPNAGKSSLLNALAGFERALVDPAPGTTRDVVRFDTAFAGLPVELLDTAGDRATDEEIEAAGIAAGRSAAATADLVLVLVDTSVTGTAAPFPRLAAWPTALVVPTKADAAREATLAALHRDHAPRLAAPTSAVTGQGLDRLVATVAATLAPAPPPPDAPLPFRRAHVARLEALRARALRTQPPDPA